ncbi:MAG: hypothetical protein M5U09_17145 [Gammaproteobacteria bacterium]|nr:hypothetical protein [Gammaproteobacteria bacterium]
MTLHDKDELLAQVLLDLSMTRTVSDGIAFARFVLGSCAASAPCTARVSSRPASPC